MKSSPFDLYQQENEAKNFRCEFCQAIQSLPKVKRMQAVEALNRPSGKVAKDRITHETIVAVLAGWGITTSTTTVSQHRNASKRPECIERLKRMMDS